MFQLMTEIPPPSTQTNVWHRDASLCARSRHRGALLEQHSGGGGSAWCQQECRVGENLGQNLGLWGRTSSELC